MDNVAASPRRLPLLSGRFIAVTAALAVMLAAGLVYLQRRAAPSTSVKYLTAAAVQGQISSGVQQTGPVVAPTAVPLSFKNAGKVAEVKVRAGDPVTAGTVLARLDDADLQAQLAQAQAALAQALAGYNSAVSKREQTTAGSRPEDVAAAQAQAESAQAKLDQARAVPQSPDIAAAQSALNTAKLKLDQLQNPRSEDVAAAQAQLDAAAAKLQALTVARVEDVVAAQSQLNSARLKLQQLQNPRLEDIRSAEGTLAGARAKLQALQNPRLEDIAAAQSQLDQARTKLAQVMDQPRIARPEDIANAQLQVQSAQAAYDKALADGGIVGKTGGPATQQASDQAVKTALINLQTAQNTLGKLQAQGPTDWDLRTAQETVDAAQANLDKLKNPNPTDVQTAQIAVDQAQAALDKLSNPSPYDIQVQQEAVNAAQAAIDKLTAPSPADIRTAQQAVVAAQSALSKLENPSPYDLQVQQEAINQAQANLEKLLTANLTDVRMAQAAVNQAQANLARLRNGSTAQEIAVAQAAVDQAQAQVDAARAAVQLAQANLSAATLTAPIDGTLAQVNYVAGQFVPGGTASAASATAFMVLTDLGHLQIDSQVNEADIGRVRAGQPVTFTVDAFPGQTFAGNVAVVQPLGTTTNNVVTYTVTIDVHPAPVPLLPGMTANVTILTTSVVDALVIPSSALSFAQSQGGAAGSPSAGQPQPATVIVVAGGKGTPRTIQTGAGDDHNTQVLSGLPPGEQVAIGTARR